jgi:hypothetical protein
VCYLHGDQGGATWNLPSTTMGLSDMVQRGLDDISRMMDARRMVAPFGIMVALTAGLARSMP